MTRPHPILIDLAAGRLRPGTSFGADAYNSAMEHRVAGLAHHGIAAGDLEVIDLLRRSSAEARVTLRARTLRLWDELADVESKLEGLGVDVAVIKGIATDLVYYPDIATRQAADLDIVVDPAHLGNMSSVLRALDPSHALVGTIDDLVAGNHIQSVDVKLASGVWLDVHVDAVKTGIELRSRQAMWDRTELHAGPDGQQLRTLCPADALVQAVIHQLKDRFSLLRGHTDIARIILDGRVDWDIVAATLEEDGLAGVFWPSLSIVLDELHLHSEVAPTPSMGTFSVNRVWPAETRLQGETGMKRKVRAKHAIPFLMKGRRFEAAVHYLRVLFPSKDLVSYQHPDYTGPYFWRLMRMRLRFAGMRHKRKKTRRELGFDD